jgi:hypothetical protein
MNKKAEIYDITAELAKEFSWNRVSREDICINQKLYY